MEPVHFGRDAYKNQPGYDDRFSDIESYEDFWKEKYNQENNLDYKSKPAKSEPRIFADFDDPDDDFRPW